MASERLAEPYSQARWAKPKLQGTMALELVVAAGVSSLLGGVLGVLMTPFTQLALEKKREQRAADRAKMTA